MAAIQMGRHVGLEQRDRGAVRTVHRRLLLPRRSQDGNVEGYGKAQSCRKEKVIWLLLFYFLYLIFYLQSLAVV